MADATCFGNLGLCFMVPAALLMLLCWLYLQDGPQVRAPSANSHAVPIFPKTRRSQLQSSTQSWLCLQHAAWLRILPNHRRCVARWVATSSNAPRALLAVYLGYAVDFSVFVDLTCSLGPLHQILQPPPACRTAYSYLCVGTACCHFAQALTSVRIRSSSY